MKAALSAGFENPPVQASHAFRMLMTAMAQPGIVQFLPFEIDFPKPLNAGSAMIMLTLLDHETPAWVDQDLSQDPVLDYLKFHCGSPIAKTPRNAMFAFFKHCPDQTVLSDFAIGTPEYPDSSTTYVIQLDHLTPDGDVALSGPGIQTVNTFGAAGLNHSFWEWAKRNHAEFPLGNDVFLASNDAIVALPRSVRILEMA
ncbi:MAG: phosphonate C-P lyase system protein PhnH [Pseudomonadota bacterium]